MARGINGVVLRQVRTLLELGAIGEMSDGQLLGRFLDDRGESGEAAFGVLVDRHGPMVFGVCLKTLGHAQEAEDAYQATFLVLASRARSIRNREALGAWLFGVARKVAARARSEALRRRTLEARSPDSASGREPAPMVDGDEIAALLEEVARLRRPLREAVVLCYLQGLTYTSAAEALGISEGTIRGRLARAREILRAKLGRRGLVRDSSASAPFAPRLLESAPARIVGPTVRGSMAIAAGRAASGIVPGSAITLMEGALKAMLTANLKTTGILAVGVGLIALGVAVRVQARQRPEAGKAGEVAKGVAAKDEASDLAALVGGKIVRSAEVTKDAIILSYMPDLAIGNVDNIGIGNNDGGVRMLVDWPDVPATEAKSAGLKFFLAFYSRRTMAKPKPGPIFAFELASEWPEEETSWKTPPEYEPDPIVTAQFEPGEGWKAFDITPVVRKREGKSGQGLMFRFLIEDRPGVDQRWSDYQFVSREGKAEWATRRPMLLVVEPDKK